jgi:non-ribosomal peptide synthetase component F
MNGGELSVRAAALEAPDRLALIAEDRAYTFAELAVSASGVAAWLRARLAEQPGSEGGPVAVVARREPEAIVALLAGFEVGVPIGLMHSRATERERQLMSELLDPALEVDPAAAVEESEPAQGEGPSRSWRWFRLLARAESRRGSFSPGGPFSRRPGPAPRTWAGKPQTAGC